MARPHTSLSIFGMAVRILVPSPAARMMTAAGPLELTRLGSSDLALGKDGHCERAARWLERAALDLGRIPPGCLASPGMGAPPHPTRCFFDVMRSTAMCRISSYRQQAHT